SRRRPRAAGERRQRVCRGVVLHRQMPARFPSNGGLPTQLRLRPDTGSFSAEKCLTQRRTGQGVLRDESSPLDEISVRAKIPEPFKRLPCRVSSRTVAIACRVAYV